MSEPDASTAGAGRTREQVLADAVRVLTEAARLTRPVLEPAPPGKSHGVVVEAFASTVGQDGSESAREVQESRVYVESGRREPDDFAEFVAQALVAVAANVGGVETVLAGRAGSWEADAVRQLLVGTVGGDEAYLLAHRTDPVVVEVLVEEILNDLGVWSNWDEAARDIARRADQVPLDAEDQEQQLDAIAVEEEQHEQARDQAWADYGQALRQQIEAAAAGQADLRVPVQVVVDLDTLRGPGEASYDDGFAEQLLQEAIAAVPTPTAPPTVPTVPPVG